jgi:hypothetical protein
LVTYCVSLTVCALYDDALRTIMSLAEGSIVVFSLFKLTTLLFNHLGLEF